MKKLLSLLLAALLLVGLLGVPALAEETTGSTVLLYTANLKGEVELYAKVAAAKSAFEAAGADVVLVDAGNYLRGSAAVNTDMGLSAYRLMEAVGYDAAALGLAELSYGDATTGMIYHGNVTRYYTQAMLQNGTEAITYNKNRDGSETGELAEKAPATFAALSANVTAGDYYAFEASTVIEGADGLRIGLYGLTDPAALENIQIGWVEEIAEPAPVELEADLVVCLSNAHLDEETFYGDLVIDASDGEPLIGAYRIEPAIGTITPLELDLSASDADVAALAAEITAAAAPVVGKSTVTLNGSDETGWLEETNLGDLTADALRWYASNYIDGLADLPIVAIQNGGNCDQFLYPGDITEVDLLRALPFSPMGIGVLQVTGAQLLETLEAATSPSERYGERCPGFAQVSGLSYIVNTGAEYDAGDAYGNFYRADSIRRVTITEVNGAPFDPEATYLLAADNYLLNGNDTYYVLSEAKEAGAVYVNNGNGVKTRDAVALYLQSELNGTVGDAYAAPQGRVTQIGFGDVPAGFYYVEPVAWAVEQNITTGTTLTTFSPDSTCNRGQILTFLWRAAGRPAPSIDNPFADVTGEEYYAQAALWAYEQGMVTGEHFEAATPCTRASTVEYLWKYAGSPEAAAELPFTDVTEADAPAVAWALEQGVTTGTTGTTFSPERICSRGQIVTFLWRAFAK